MVFAQGFFDGIEDGLNNAWQGIVGFAPKLIGALLILLIGWFVARLIRSAVETILTRVGFDRLLDRAGLSNTLKNAGYSASGLVARIIYWIALLIVFLMAAETLDIGALTELLQGLIAYLPLIIVAMVIIVVAAALGAFVADLVKPWADQQNIGWLDNAVRWAILGFGIFASLNTLNVAEEIVNTLFIALLATVGVSLAIAFGVGGIKAAEGWWNRMLPNRTNTP